MEWVSVAAVFVAFALGVFVGWRWHRVVMIEAIRKAGQLAAAQGEPSPIDHDAMYRIIKDHQGDR